MPPTRFNRNRLLQAAIFSRQLSRFGRWDGFDGTASVYAEAPTDHDLHRREAGAVLADVPSRPEWQRAKRIIVSFEFVPEFAPTLAFFSIKGIKPILHFGTVVYAEATSNKLRHAARRR